MTKTAALLLLAFIGGGGCASMAVDGKKTFTVTMDAIDLQGPMAARLGVVRLNALSAGGEGEISYAWHTMKGGLEAIEQQGPESVWSWQPKEAGSYFFKVRAKDAAGRVAESGWAGPYKFRPPLDSGSLYAVLPLENLSGGRAPLSTLHAAWVKALADKGLQLFDQAALAAFMEKYRVRYTGGLSSKISKKIHDETGVDACIITSLETWQGGVEPRVSLITRVVLTGDRPEIVWMDSVGLTADDAPGLLGLGRIRSSEQLLDKALAILTGSLQLFLAGGYPSHRHSLAVSTMAMVNNRGRTADAYGPKPKGLHSPKFHFRARDFEPTGQYTVAVIPFLNVNTRKNAGEIVALHLVSQLQRYENIRVVEPGVVRQILLKYRMIMEAGPSLATSDVLANENILGAGLIMSGKVFDYQGEIGESKVDFSVQVFDGPKRQIVWTSRSYATGEQNVYFFGLGRIPSAQGLSSRMMQSVVGQFLR